MWLVAISCGSSRQVSGQADLSGPISLSVPHAAPALLVVPFHMHLHNPWQLKESHCPCVQRCPSPEILATNPHATTIQPLHWSAFSAIDLSVPTQP